MKRLTLLIVMAMAMTSFSFAQRSNFNKITPDLQEELAFGKADEMFRVIIIMNEQIDSHKSSQQLMYLGKEAQRKFMANELQQLSQRSQKELLKDLQQGQKAAIVDEIKSFWIINAVSCMTNKSMVQSIAERPDVKYVMKDLEIKTPDGEMASDVLPERSENQWNVTKVHAPEVWDLGYTGQGIIVAVIDSGVNYNHTDIADNMWDGGSEYPNHGWDFVNNDDDPMDDQGHGSHCAGTVASSGTNGKQCGIAIDARIMALKTLYPDPNNPGQGTGLISNGWAAVEFAVSYGADILSMSLGSPGYGGYWAYRVVMENVLSCGIIASVSAGNDGNKLSTYPRPNNVGSPGNCPSPWRNPDQTLNGGRAAVVTVGATTISDTHSSFSSYGPSTWAAGDYIGFYNDYPWTDGDATNIGLIKPDISAPGSDIWSLSHTSNTGYLSMNGTSMAAPCVAGVMALMLSANPTLTPVEIDSIIETTAIPCAEQTSKNNTFGAGRIDALAAINYMLDACAPPTNLEATDNGANVTLSWDAAENVSTYRVYRNGVMIANTVSETTYLDENAPAGTNVYFVRSNGENYKASLPSNQVSVNISTNVEIAAPSNLSIGNMGENNVTLNWETPEPQVKTLCYSESETTDYTGLGNAELTAGQRFPSSMLQQFNGMQIEHIYFSVKNSDVECIINLYEGDAMQPAATPIHSGSIRSTEEEQAIDYSVDPPVIVNSNKDLWLTITMSDKLLADNEYDSQENGDAFMFRETSTNYWLANLGIAWMFKIGFSNGEYTYNVYRNGQVVSSNQNTATYIGNYVEGMNEFHVSSVSNGYESTETNSIRIVKTASTQDNIALGTDDKLIVLPGSTLTVLETLSNDNAENLILEDGAQLIHNSDGVKATVKKTIAPYSGEKDNWYFIASPAMEDLAPSEDNGLLSGTYDLYFYDEPTYYWRNYRQGQYAGFNIEPQKGYLYANNTETTLQFAGTLAPSDEDIPVTNLSHSATTLNGFNLIGNPFACNATVNKDCYIIDGESITLAEESPTLAPCEGVMVKADSDQFAVTFTKASGAKGNGKSLDLVVSQDKATLDRARVRMGEGTNMEKFGLDGNKNTTIALQQDGQDYAVAYTDGQNELPVIFKAAKNGTYTIAIEANNLGVDYLHLIDNMTGADVDLLATKDYTFTAKTTDYASRFRLLFAPAEENVNDCDAPFAYISNGEIVVVGDAGTGDAGTASLQVMDVTGRVVRVCTDGVHTVSTSGIPAGVYVLRLIDSENVRTQKIVIE